MIRSHVKKYICIAFAGCHLANANGISSLSPIAPHSSIFLRGGASESAASWSAGSKYNNYRTSPYSPTRNSYKTTSVYTADSREKTKEAFAEAFLRREDRNRFIGEEIRFIFILKTNPSFFSHNNQILIRSKSLCNIIRATPFHSWYHTCIPCISQRA